MPTTIYYHKDSGVIHSVVNMSRRGGLSKEQREMGLLVKHLTPEEELRYNPRWESIEVSEAGDLLGADGKRFNQVNQPVHVPIEKADGRTVLMVSSYGVPCGIAEYTKTLMTHLRPHFHCEILLNAMLREARANADLIHIQYEPGLYDEGLSGFIEAQSVPIVITAHFYDDWLHNNAHLFSHVIVHSPEIPARENQTYIVQGCPVFDEIRDKVELRKRLKLPMDKRILTGFGLIMAWKQIDYFFGYLAPILERDPNLYVQLLHAKYPPAGTLGDSVAENVESVIADLGIRDRIYYCWDFLDKAEINERLQASDVGFVWGHAVSRGSSATTKEYIAARCPLVVSDCAHYADLKRGMVKVPPTSAQQFLHSLLSVAYNDELLESLREGQRENYRAINYEQVALKHCEIYRRAL